jgi:hypothetical protein
MRNRFVTRSKYVFYTSIVRNATNDRQAGYQRVHRSAGTRFGHPPDEGFLSVDESCRLVNRPLFG